MHPEVVTTPILSADEEEMPDVTGMGARDVVYLLQGMGLRVKLKGVGRVVRQSIQPGAKGLQGKQVVLTME